MMKCMREIKSTNCSIVKWLNCFLYKMGNLKLSLRSKFSFGVVDREADFCDVVIGGLFGQGT